MATNPSMILQYIELNLGASLQILELTQEEIMNIVYSQSLYTYSYYFPYYTLLQIDPQTDKVPNRFNTYYIKTDYEVIGVSKLLAENYMGNSGLPLAYYDSDPVNRQLTADIASMFLQPITFQYEPPNIISIFPKTQLLGTFTVQLKVVHPKHLATISLPMSNEFMELALYDVRIALYPIRERFKSINTTFGNVDLFMDKLDSAWDDKKQLLEKWEQMFLRSPEKRKMFIA